MSTIGWIQMITFIVISTFFLNGFGAPLRVVIAVGLIVRRLPATFSFSRSPAQGLLRLDHVGR